MVEHKKDSKKRKRETGVDGPTVGQLTSHITNKQVRSEQYAKLKHKAKVSVCFTSLAATPCESICGAFAVLYIV